MMHRPPQAEPGFLTGCVEFRARLERSRSGPGLWVAWILLVATAPLLAQADGEPIDPERSWALVVGVSGYSRAEPLPFAASDAQAFSDFLKSPRGGAFSPDRVFTLLEEKASRTGIEYELEQMWDRVQAGDRIIAFIAGHGLINKRGIAYFLPLDGDIRAPNSTSINLLALQQQFTQGFSHAGQRILITDMCHAGTLQEAQNLINDYILKKFHSQDGGSFLNLLASAPDEPSWESAELGRGVFTHVLLEGLNGRGLDGAGSIVQASQIVDFVQREVPKWTGQQQHPVVNESFEEALPLAYLDRPGPGEVQPGGDASLLLVHSRQSPFVRAKWINPEDETVIVQRIPPDRDSFRLSSLQPGTYELEFFDAENNASKISLTLQPGENQLDIQGPDLGQSNFSDGRFLVASLQPQSALAARRLPGPSGSGDSPGCSLLLKPGPEVEVFLDGEFYGTTLDPERLFQVRGLEPGPRLVRLVYPHRERRYRLKLLPGRQLLKVESGEVLSLHSLQPPPRFRHVPEAVPERADGLYRSFLQAIWNGRLVSPSGDCAWDLYQRLREVLEPGAAEGARRDLIVAMGDQAQRLILRYLQGGDVRWDNATFRQGEELVTRLQEVFKTSPFYSAQQYFFQGRALIEENDSVAAARVLQQATRLDPEASYAYNALGLAFWQQGAFPEALQVLDRSIELTPRWSYPRVTRALIFIEQRLYEAARLALDEAVRIDPENSTVWRAQAQLQMLTGRLAQAGPSLEKALQFHPGNAYAYQTLGNLHRRQLRPAEAEASYRLAILLEPSEPSFRIDLASLLQEAGRISEARDVHDRLLEEFPGNSRVLEARAAFLAAAGQFQAAESIYRSALEILPRDTTLRVNYALFLEQQKRRGEAERELKRVLRTDRKNPFALFQLARLAFDGHQLQEAERLALKATEAEPFYAPPQLLLGQIRFSQRKHDEARELFRSAARLAVDGHQRQQAEEAIREVEERMVEEALARADDLAGRGRSLQAWDTYRDALRRNPRSRPLRNHMLEFIQDESPDLSSLPPSSLAEVVRTGLWAAHQEATRLWTAGDHTGALEHFAGGLQDLDDQELRVVGSTAFNFENDAFGTHQWVIDWARRHLERGEYAAGEHLLEIALEKKLFAVVPDYRPLTIDSLMVPEGAERLEDFSDFDVAHHPDSRFHVLRAAFRAGAGQVDEAIETLRALESSGPHLEARNLISRVLEAVDLREDAVAVLQPAVRSILDSGQPEAQGTLTLIHLARLYCRSGDCERGRSLLRRGMELFPDQAGLNAAWKELQ